MTNIGTVRLRRAATDWEPTLVCVNCGSDRVQLAEGSEHGRFYCPECEAFEDSRQLRNDLADALELVGNDVIAPEPRHLNALAEHAEELHLRIAELEQLLLVEQQRNRELAAA